MIVHLAEPDAWAAAEGSGAYASAGLATEGFIHCATPEQAPGVIERYYSDRADLVALWIDESRLGARVVWENTAGGDELFPHVYGLIEVAAVVRVTGMREATA